MVYGANVVGTRCGVYGESVTSFESNRESQVPGVGVHGRGENFGVVGDGPGIAAVYGSGNRSKVGVLGGAMREGIGVVGASMASLNPSELVDMPVKGTGHGIGVYGTSGKGTGVQGSSGEGAGVRGDSDDAVGVQGESIGGVGVLGHSDLSAGMQGTGQTGVKGVGVGGSGGVFESDKFAQVNLGPLFQLPQLPCEGKAGDLLAVSPLTPDEEDPSPQGVASLWFCTKAQTKESPAVWARVAFNGIATCDLGLVPTPPGDLPFLKE